jgi:hypothetical protein
VDELESYIAQRKITLHQAQECLAMVIFEKHEAFMAAMKPILSWRIETITTMEKSRHYKKCLFKLNKRIVRINRVY